MGQGLFFLQARPPLAVHCQPVGVGPLPAAPPQLQRQQILHGQGTLLQQHAFACWDNKGQLMTATAWCDNS